MIEYDGTTSLQKALEELHGRKLSFDALSKITSKYRERLNIPTGKLIGKTADKLKIYQWERDAIPPKPIIEVNEIHTQNDTKACDKFININYRHTDNSRHTVQIEQFYIDALIAIGITDISKFVAENAGLKSVTKNVKRSIVNELVKRTK
jgi:hypothetical protein